MNDNTNRAAEAAQPASSVKSWQERCSWQSNEPATKLMVEAMKAEIAELREVIKARIDVDRNEFWDGVNAKYPNAELCDYTDSWARQNEKRNAMWQGIALACHVFSRRVSA